MYRVIKVLNNNGILVLDDASGQERFKPIAYGFENSFHSASPP